MKEYYKAAAEAYANGDQERAFKLIKEGQFYRAKAVEADEKSTQKNLETRLGFGLITTLSVVDFSSH